MRVETLVFGVAVVGFVCLSVDALSTDGKVTRTRTATDYADSDRDPCFNKPCQHKGLCTKPSPEAVTYACDCANTGYEGAHCETGIISLPDNVRVRAGELSDDVILTAFPEQELILTAESGNDVQVFPNQLLIQSNSTSVVFKILAPLQGKFSIRFRASGADAGSFSDVTTFDVLSDDVFSKYQIPLERLPEGSYFIDLSLHGYDYKFTSTSPWYRLNSDRNIFFTKGVTFSSVGNVSLPMSVTGLEVNTNGKLVVGKVSGLRNPNVSTVVSREVIRRSRQEPFELSVKDINDFINKNSILRTVFASLELVLPPWLRFLVTSNSSEPFFSAQISSGSTVKKLPYCAGAPVFDDSVYHVFRFTHAIVMTLVNQDLYLPETNSEQYCMILDLNKDFGTTFMMMFPRKSAALLEQVEVFKKLKQQTGVRLFLNGFGLSFLKKLNVRPNDTELDLWNGDERFKHQPSQTATVWLSLDAARVRDPSKSFDFSIASVPIETYADPDIRKILTHVFVDPWEVYLRAGDSPLEVTFYIKILNKPFELTISSGKSLQYTIQAFGSVGLEARKYCGLQANPPGIFTTVFIDAKLLRGAPVIQDFFFNVNLKADFFYRLDDTDIANVPKPIDVIKAVLAQAKQAGLELLNFVKAEIQKYISLIDPVILQAIQQVRQLIEGLLQIVNQFLNGFDVTALITNVADLVRDIVAKINSLERQVGELKGLVRIMFEDTLKSFITFVESKVQEIKTNALTMVQTLHDEAVGIFKGPKTFGVQGKFSIVVLGKDFGIEGGFVRSDAHLGRCGDFVEINAHMQGEAAWRAFGVVHLSKIKGKNKLWEQLSVRPGFRFELALASDSNNFVVQLGVRLNFFGGKATCDLFVTKKSITARAEVKIWDIFTARLTIGATVLVDFADWALQIRGEFIPGGGRKRQAENSVQASLGDAMRKFVNRLKDDALKRIDKAQEAVNSGKRDLTKAQNWLDEKKRDVDKANVAFDNAIAGLEWAKGKLEAAKGPFKRARDKLTAAQRKVDSICRIKTCSSVCIPGFKAGRCWVLFAYVPCPKWTNCMTEITDPICVTANLACKGVRAIAFGALEVAKLGVGAPTLALDVAKGGLSVAQVVVDKSRVVLNVAKSAFDAAKPPLELAKHGLNGANAALDVVKVAVRAVQFVINFIVKYGIQNIIDIGACGFETKLSTKDLFEFETSCDVNPFRLGWRTVRFRLNFRDISGSIWKAAQSLVNGFLESVKKMLGRRKREIDYVVFSRLHKTFRYGHQADNGTFDESIFENIEDRVTNNTVLTNTTSRSETEFWKEQCGRYSPIVNFLRFSIEELRNVTCEMDALLGEVATRGSETIEIRNTILSTHADDSEIDYTIAEEDFNVTRKEIVNVVREVNTNLQEDDLMKECKDVTEYIIGQNDEAMRSFAAVEILPLWRERMESATKELMLTDECSGFYDCVVWSFGDLYQLVDSVDPLLLPGAQEKVPPLEELFYSLFDNDTQSFMVLKDVTTEILNSLRLLNADDVFCGTVPEITKGPANVTVRSGDSFTLTCSATSVPDPTFFWLKNEELYASGASLTLTAVDTGDAGEYVCVAGNHVANVSTDPATVTVISPPVLLSRLPTRLEVAVGDNVSVVCDVSATPKAHIRWVKKSDDRISIENATFQLSDVQLSDAGIYKCNAENVHGRISSNKMTLGVQEVSPLCPKLTLGFGFISDTADAVKQTDTLLPRKVDRLSLDTAFEEVIILLANSTTLPLSVGVVIPASPPNVASLSMTTGCDPVPQKCSYAGCVQIYDDAHTFLQTAITRIQEAILADKPLFIRDGNVYYFNPSMVNIPEESNSCRSGFKEMDTKLCAKLSGV